VSIREAGRLADVVFSHEVRGKLNRTLRKTENSVHADGFVAQTIASNIASELQDLIDQMNREAELRPSDDL
jgi:hypothetical protein